MFQNAPYYPPFENSENALSPEGSLRKQNPKGSIDGLSILLCVPERVLGIFVFGVEIRVSEILKMFYCVGGWVGGDFLPPSIFFTFKYHDKQVALVLKMCLKVAYAF